MAEITADNLIAQPVHRGTVAGLVRELFSALHTAQVEYCLLRGYEELLVPNGYLEIDLLVRPDHVPQLAHAIAPLGFVELPSWGHAPHIFFVTFDSERGDWVKLDVVTQFRYGKPIRRFHIPLAQECLERRRFGEVYRLAVADEFFTLFLHCLLDKGRFQKKHRTRLLGIVEQADERSKRQVHQLIDAFLTPVLTWDGIESAIQTQDWGTLESKSGSLEHLFTRKDPKSVWRNVSSQLVRKLRPLFFALSQRGSSLALLAPDGAGKSTLAAALVRDGILKGRLIYMGTNVRSKTVGLPTTRWLHERRKAIRGKGGALNPWHLAVKTVNFVNNLCEQWLRAGAARYHLLRGRLVIFDRFIYDSWVNKKPKTVLKRIRRALFEAWLPRPDLVIYLDAPGEVLFERKGEHSPEWLEQQRQSYHALRERIPQMQFVNAANSAEAVRRDVVDLVWKNYGLRLNPQKNPSRVSTPVRLGNAQQQGTAT